MMLLLALTSFGGAPAQAENEWAAKRFEIGGFGTLGLARTDTNDAQYVRDQTQPDGIGKNFSGKLDSLVGLQANFRATDSLDLVVQAISRYGPRGDYHPEVSWAFAKYDFTPNLTGRIGRMGTEFYLLADSRHVGYSYLTVRPPVDFFGVLAFHHVDGVDLTGSAVVGDGVLKGKMFAGQANELAPIGREFLSLRGNPLAGFYVDYQAGPWQWRATAAQMRFKHDLPSPVTDLRSGLSQMGAFFSGANTAADALALKNTTSRFYSLGAVYDNGPLQVQAMLSQLQHESLSYQNSNGGYLLAGYRFGQVTPFAGYSWTQSKSRQLSSGFPSFDVMSATLNAGLAASLARVHTHQQTYTAGARWDFRQDMALKAQLDMIRGKPESIFLYPMPNTTNTAFDGKLNVFSLSLDFVF